MTGPTAVMSIIGNNFLSMHVLTRKQVKTSIPRNFHGMHVVEGTSEWTNLAYALALITGVLQISLCLLGLGFIVDLVSEPVITGFTSAAAVLIILTQLPGILGLHHL